MATPTTNLRIALDGAVKAAGATSLEAFVRARRTEGASWRRVATDLRDATAVDLTAETLRGWFPELEPVDDEDDEEGAA